jgi:multidrug efflux pump subunit AcrA (membrane-fusion protein)
MMLAFRALLLGVALAALGVGIGTGRLHPGAADATACRYVCPMHAEVRTPTPGACPICGMALERAGVDRRGGGATAANPLAGMADLTAVDNVRKHRLVDFVRVHSLLRDLRELRGPAWVGADRVITAILYKDQIAALRPDEPGTFSLTDAPDRTFTVHRTEEPVRGWDGSTGQIRFRVDQPPSVAAEAPSPSAGQVGWLALAPRPRAALGVPASAVLQSPDGPYVLTVVAGGARIEKRPVEIGETFLKQGFAVVLSGLQVHDRVVGRAAFFLDADRRLADRAASTDWVDR